MATDQNIIGAVMEPDLDDDDSALGDFDDGSSSGSTASLASSIRNYRIENNRSYHGYKDGSYILPNDEEEKDRLDLQHHMSLLTLDNKLYLSPIDSKIQTAIDIGTGTGIWAIEFAEAHPSAKVIGNDLSPIQPTFVPPNLTFEVDDAEADWTYSHGFDFIHARMLTGSFKNWPRFFQQAFKNANPGGWFELHDMCFPIQCDDASLTPEHAVFNWSKNMQEGMQKAGQPIDIGKSYKRLMIDAGFEDVTEVVYKWPISPWPKAEKEKTLGTWERVNFLEGLPGFTLAIFTRILGFSKEEVEIVMAGVRKDIRNKAIHAYFPIYVVYGKKPIKE